MPAGGEAWDKMADFHTKKRLVGLAAEIGPNGKWALFIWLDGVETRISDYEYSEDGARGVMETTLRKSGLYERFKASPPVV